MNEQDLKLWKEGFMAAFNEKYAALEAVNRELLGERYALQKKLDIAHQEILSLRNQLSGKESVSCSR